MGTIAYEIYPLTPERWDDFTALFGAHGAVGGCWCMYWRREGAWQGGNGDANREKMHALVQGGAVTGLLAYAGEQAVGWVSVAPRGDYAALATKLNVPSGQTYLQKGDSAKRASRTNAPTK